MINFPVGAVGRFLRAASILIGLLVGHLAQAQKLPIKSFSAAVGVPGGGISQITKDSHGFLWFCGSDGIARFDGRSFTRLSAASGWPAQAVHSFLQTRDGCYWIATSQGLFRLDPLTSQEASVPLERKVQAVQSWKLAAHCLLEDEAGVLWCGTSAGLFRVDREPAPGVLRPVDLGFPHQTTVDPMVTALALKEGGGLWIGAGSGLYALNRDGSAVHPPVAGPKPSTHFIRSIAAAKDGSVWLATASGVTGIRLRPESRALEQVAHYSTANGLGNPDALTLLVGLNGEVFVGTASGLSIIRNNGIQNFDLEQGIEGPVFALTDGAPGELWLGSDHGVQRWANAGFTTYNGKGHLKSRVNSLLEDQTGTLVTVKADDDAYDLQRMVGNQLVPVRLELPPGSRKPGWGWHQPLLQDHLGAWWYATAGGICRLEATPSSANLPKARHLRTYKVEQVSGSDSDEIFALFEDSRGDIWFSNVANPINGLGRWVRAEDRIEGFNGRAGIPMRPALATAFAEDHAGNVWVAFNMGGVARFRNGRFKSFGTTQGIPECWIRSMRVDSKGRLWLACSVDGVRIVMDPDAASPSVRTFTTEQGLAANSIWSFVEDLWGRVYVGTGAGIDRVELEQGHVFHLSEANGLAPGIPRDALRDRNGALWFGLSGGLSRYQPQAPTPTRPPPIYLIGLRVAGAVVELPESGTIGWEIPQLQPRQNRIQIDFTSPEALNQEALRYQYRLEGVSDDWSPQSSGHGVDFANLAAGHYHFQVRAVGVDGIASAVPAELRFTILRPIWLRWWFLSLAFVAASGAGWLAYRYRLRHLLEVEQIRTRIAADLHDDIGASLSRISILSEVVKRRLGEDQSESAGFLSEIADSSRELVDSMSEIVWSIDPRRDNLKHLLARVGQFANGVLEAKGIKWAMTVPPDPWRIKLSTEQRRNLYLILKEAINNAMKHSGCNTVTLNLEVENGVITATLKDDGCGLPPPSPERESSAASHGRGLINMEVRAFDLGGELDFISGPDGTLIHLKVPLRPRWGA